MNRKLLLDWLRGRVWQTGSAPDGPPPRETPHALLLARERARAEVRQHFGDAIELAEDVAAYGSHLVPRCLNTAAQEEELTPIIVLGVFGRQVVAMLDSIALLTADGAGVAATIQLRSLIEASVYGEWILGDPSKHRARSFYVWNLRHQRRWARRAIPGTVEHERFKAMLGSGYPGFAALQPPERTAEAQKEIAKIEQTLAQPVYQAINATFDRERRGSNDWDVPWHVVAGERSLAAIARALDRGTDYEFFSIHSKVAHTSGYLDHFSYRDGVVSIMPIRSLIEVSETLRHALTTAFRTYRYLLERYRPDELPAYDRKHASEWSSRHGAIKDVRVEILPLLR